MKVAISSVGKNIDSEVDLRFGRCPFFVIVNIKNNKIMYEKTIENISAMQPGGAGIAAAQLIGNEKVDAVITGNIGPNALGILQQLGIKVYQGVGSVKEVVQQLVEKKLKLLTVPVSPHFGMGFGNARGFRRRRGM